MSEHPSPTGFIPPSPDQLAALFPGYEIVRLIACGGMGAVYEAVQRSLDRPVAIKILPSEFTTDESFRTNFQSEAKAMARLNHPNLIGVYDFGEIDGMLFIIMEYVAGQSLHQATQGQPVAPQDAARLVISIANGLAHAHENGIIHRDIKPANILLDHRNEPKIGDFGLARPLESQIQEGEDIFGTPGYTAPEVIGNPQSIDHRADIFSLGILLHEILTGKLPGDDPRPASAICQCDPRFDVIIRKATQPFPTSRYPDAESVATALQKILTSAGPRVLQTQAPARQNTKPRATYPRPTRQPASKAPIVVILLIVIAVVGFILHQKSTRTVETEPPDTTTQTPSPKPSTPTPPRPSPVGPTPIEEPEPTPSSTQNIEGVYHWGNATSSWETTPDATYFTIESGPISQNRDDGVFKSEPFTGDGFFTVRIHSSAGGHPTESTAGIMIRESTSDGSRHLFLARTTGGDILIRIRSRENRDSDDIMRIPASHTHLGIQRTGDKLTAATSNDGNSWTDLGTFTLSSLSPTLHIGFAAASGSRAHSPLIGSVHPVQIITIDDIRADENAPPPNTNIDELFARARSVMKEQASPVIARQQNDFQANLASYIRESQRKIDTLAGADRDRFAGHHENVIAAVNTMGHIAYNVPASLRALDGFAEIHRQHLERQHEISRQYTREMADLEAIYLNGIRRQIERSQAEGDAGTVAALEAENRRVTTFPHYFRSLMMP